MLDVMGLTEVADGSRPLTAEQMGQLVQDLTLRWIQNDCPTNHQQLIEIKGIHQRLRELSTP
jgi:hypothetical protein